LLAWFVTHALYFGLAVYGLFPASLVADNWGSLLIAANIYGYFLTFFSYAKAYLFPSHPDDRKFSNSWAYDLFMGIEFNPRFGKYFDFKLFHNGRPGIVAWTLINASFAAAQYNEIGYVTNSMILLNLLHAIYVLDFFYNEDWYLRTIDIAQ
jgi:7-dehydrocholesterol reductase